MNGYDVYGRGMGMASQGWASLMQGLREGTQGVMQGLQTREILKQQKRQKENEELKDKAEGIFQRFTQGLYNLKDMGVISDYKDTVSKSDKALVLQMVGVNLDTFADTFSANVEATMMREAAETGYKQYRKEKELEREYELRKELRLAPAWQPSAEPEKPAVMTPAQARTELYQARGELRKIEKDMAELRDTKGNIIKGNESRSADLERDRREILDEIKKYQKMLGLATAPTMEEVKRTMPYQFQGLQMPWMPQGTPPPVRGKTPEDIYKQLGF